MKNTLEKLEKSKANLVEALNKLKPVVANGDIEEKEEMCSKKELYEVLSSYTRYIDNQLSNIYTDIHNLYSDMYKHTHGHLPKLSPSQLKKVLVNCDLGEDFEVAKTVIYASKGQLYVSFDPDKKPV